MKYPNKRIKYDEQIRRFAIKKIEQGIKQAEDAVAFQYDLELREASKDKKLEVKEKIFKYKLWARSRIVKKSYAEFSGIKKVKEYLEKNYRQELYVSKYEYFPRKWMTANKKIKSILKRYPLINIFLNYLFNYNRRLTEKQRNKMIKLTDSVTGGKRYKTDQMIKLITNGKKHNVNRIVNLITGDKPDDGNFYAAYIVDGKFWEKAAEKLDVTEGTLKRYFKAFVDVGIVIRLGRVATHKKGQPPYLCADGYFVHYKEITRKIPFLKKSREGKDALRNLPDYL